MAEMKRTAYKNCTNKNRLRIYFRALVQNDLRNAQNSNLDVQSQHVEILNVISILQIRRLRPDGKKITPLTRNTSRHSRRG